jgi:acetyl esterase
MPVDPEIQVLLDAGSGVPDTHTMSVPDARAAYERRIAAFAPPAFVKDVREIEISGPGGPLKLRIYTPPGTGPFPLVVFFHGSGFVLCSLDTHDGMCRNICAGAACVVVSVDYRLAPEHKFPAGLEDCLHATRWAAMHAGDLGADASQLVIAGDSAGGNLAAVAAIRLREEGQPLLKGQVLIYPVTDYHTPGTPSYAANAEGFGLSRKTMEWFWAHYLTRAEDGGHPDASPLRAASLRDLPPALVITAAYDPLCDEGELYAHALTAAGVRASLSRYDGMNHGFLFWVGRVKKADTAMAEICAWLKALWSA